jgi:arabinofuranosyltransferase
MKQTRASRAGGIAVALLTLVFLAWTARFLSRASFHGLDGRRYFALFDDALISMRYGWNLAHGHGLVWNAGERVEGYTNLLMTLVMSAVSMLFDRRLAPLAIQALGVATVLAVAAVSLRLARAGSADDGERVRAVLPVVAFGGTLAFYPLAYWSFMGMETGLLTLLFLLAVLAAERGAPARAAVLCGLATLCRPDAILLAGVVALAAAQRARARDGDRAALAALVRFSGLALAFPAGQLLFRLAYYGSALPNTYVLKLGAMPLGMRIQNGFAFLGPFLIPAAVMLLPLLAAALRRPDRWIVLAAGSLVLLAGYQIVVGGDPWPYWRIVTPAVPLALIVFARQLLRPLARAPGVRGAGGAALACAATVALIAWLDAPFSPEILMQRRAYQYEANRDNVNLALAIDSLTTPAASVGVLWAGGVPYYSMRPAVDFLGKTDPAIARRAPDLSGAVAWSGMSSVPGHNKYDLEWSIVRRRPDFVQSFTWGRQDLRAWGRARYDSVAFRGVGLWLRRDSRAVRWEKLSGSRPDGAARDADRKRGTPAPGLDPVPALP